MGRLIIPGWEILFARPAPHEPTAESGKPYLEKEADSEKLPEAPEKAARSDQDTEGSR